MNSPAVARAQRVLMCAPTHFQVSYEINPWMSVARCVDRDRAARQWETLRACIAEHAEVVLIDPQPGLPDMVFTANAGVVAGNRAVPSRFSPLQRQPEERWFTEWFASAGFSIHSLDQVGGFEGAGDCLADTLLPIFWAGYGTRSRVEFHARLQSLFGREVVSLKLVDPRFYHLDTCLAPLQGGYLMYFPAAFDGDSLAAIHARVPQQRRIEVDEADACDFVCNAVNLGNRIIVHRASASLQRRLTRLGFVVDTVELGEFLKSGGSAKCLSLLLDELP